MPPRVAIPLPHASDPEYALRAIPQYERAIQLAGGDPVRIALDRTSAQVADLIATCAAVVLPGSKADVDPARFSAPRSRHTAAADPRRDAVDDLLLEDAYKLRKPVLGICYGLQSLNVFRRGSLVQHIPDFLPETTRAKINHEAGRKVAVAHTVAIDANSKLAQILSGALADANPNGDCHPERSEGSVQLARKVKLLPVNSSHHQSAEKIGDGLRIVARCPDDGIIEALEGTSPDHFVIAVQWHPERSVDDDAASRALFRALIEAAHKQ
jgi:putative glutamine amidotransferase